MSEKPNLEAEKRVREELLEWGSKPTWLISRGDLENLINTIDSLRAENEKLQQIVKIYALMPPVPKPEAHSEEFHTYPQMSKLSGAEAIKRATDEGLTVSAYLDKHNITTISGWNGKCVECKGDGPFRLPPENSKYKYTEICAWCRAMILKEDRETHPKAKDGGPA